MASDAAVAEIRAPAEDCIEVLLTLSPGQYAQMGDGIAILRRRLDLPNSASNTHVILEAVRRQAASG
jgi:hypothetical protein